MKKRNNAFARLVGLLLVSATVLTLTVAATGGAGTSSDPLVTLSYLNEKFLPQILSEVDKKAAAREQELSRKLTEQVRSETKAFEQKYGGTSGSASGCAARTVIPCWASRSKARWPIPPASTTCTLLIVGDMRGNVA